MKSLIVGCALLLAGSCAALAQQDPTPAQGGSPNAPAPAAAATTPSPTASSPSEMKPMGRMAMHGMHHRGMMMHHKKMMHHHGMMMHHRRMMRSHMMSTKAQTMHEGTRQKTK